MNISTTEEYPSIEVWVVDDDESIRWVLEKSLARDGMVVRAFEGSTELLDALNDEQPDVLLSDIRMPGIDGLALLERVRARWPTLPVIIMTAHSDLDAAVASYKGGAFEYLPKPFDLDTAATLVRRAAKPRSTVAASPTTSATTAIIGEAPAMQDVFRAIGRLAQSNITVMVTGESGTGKELVASALHQTSPRAAKPFIAINTAAIPKDLLESEFFGHERGAFTGAATLRKGRFEQADGGTLFLDEIGDMPADLQTRLLRVLQNGEFYRVGGTQPIKVDVRVVAATHQNLDLLVAEGRFREDLYHRLNVIRVRIPALRERREDVPYLMRHFLQRAGEELKTATKLALPEVMSALSAYHWPGNVRQLENVCRWLTVMAPGREIHLQDLPPEILLAIDTMPRTEALAMPRTEALAMPAAGTVETVLSPRPVLDATATSDWLISLRQWGRAELGKGRDGLLDEAAPAFERVLLEVALEATKGQRIEAAKRLGWGRNTLTRKIKELGLGDDE